MRRVVVLFISLCVVVAAASFCMVTSGGERSRADVIISYRDIPGISEEEILAIEAIRASGVSLSFGSILTPEAYILPDGDYAGFTVNLGRRLSDLFGIPITHNFYDWDDLIKGLNNKTIDFTSELTATTERRRIYYMTHPVAERSLSAYLRKDSGEKNMDEDFSGLRIGFLEGTITAESIVNSYPELSFGIVNVSSVADAVAMLRSGEIDAFIEDGVLDFSFEEDDFIISRGIFPLVYTPVSITTANPELEPIITAVSKYIETGGIDTLYELYKQGEDEYSRYILEKSLTGEEKAYLDGLTARGAKVRVALEGDNYPISFYNEAEREFQGIAVDILQEISGLTGIEFETITDKDTTWTEVMEKLRVGEISMVSELLYSEARESDYIWSLPYSSSYYALLSKLDYPDIQIYQIVRATVGIVAQTAYEDTYHSWFPGSSNTVRFNTPSEAFDAMERGEIDLLMDSEHALLGQTNYREKSGYKVNIRFNTAIDSQFGFPKSEGTLRSIIDKAQAFVKTDAITNQWTQRVFDYSMKYAQERMVYLTFFAAILLSVLLMMLYLYTKNRRMSKNFEEQATTLSTIYSSIPDLVYCKDINCNYTSCNPSFEEFAGCGESQIIGKNATELFLVDKDMADSFIAIDQKVLRDDATVTVEEWFTYPDGSRRLFETIKTPLRKNGTVIGLLGISRNIMEHKAAIEEAYAASMAKSVFLARMSHEIRTPINVVMGMSELILRGDVPPEIFEYVMGIRQASANLLSIINDILDFTKVEAGKLEIIPAEYAVPSLISDVLSIIQAKISEKPLSFAVKVDSGIPGRLIGDETRLRQILLNLLDNAVKYTKEGYIALTVSCDMQDDTAVLTFEVSDNGIGIRPEDMDKLFDDFVQLDSQKNKGISGAGLGLAISRNLCRAMGGDILARSEYGYGSTFTVTVPQKLCTREKLANVENPDKKQALIYEPRSLHADAIFYGIDNLGVDCVLTMTQPQFYDELRKKSYPFVFISSFLYESVKHDVNSISPGSKVILVTEYGELVPAFNVRTITMPAYSVPIANALNDVQSNATYTSSSELDIPFTAPSARILIVDDVDTNLRVAEGLMLPYEMSIDVCKSGAEAIKLAQRNKYDLIFMDHMMPEMDGIEATKKIRELENGSGYYKKLPIIALTANAISGMREMFLNSGLNDFLAKPIEMSKLNGILEKWIPHEKREKGSGKEVRYPAQIHFEIDGIDIKTGISMTGGTLENYLDTLAVFYKDMLQKKKEIEDCLDKNDTKLYTTYVHAIKSAAASIGAANISDFAKTLEIAGRSEAISFIAENTKVFLAELEALLENIKLSIPIGRVSRELEVPGDELIKLKDALERMDAREIGIIMKTLENKTWDTKISENIENISELILLFEYDEAIALIDKLF